MRIKFTTTMLLNSHIASRPAYVLNTGKWNEESTDYYSNIIEESTHLTPAQRQKSSFSSQQLFVCVCYRRRIGRRMRTTNARAGIIGFARSIE